MKQRIPTLLAGACLAIPLHALGAADLLVVNARIFTANPQQPFAEALAVEDGRILAVGDEAGLRALADGDSQVVDLGGKRLMPGLIDTHSHAVFGGLELAGADMGNEQVGLDELERRLRAWRDNGKARHGDMLNVSGMHTAYWSQVKDFRARFDHGEWADQPLAFIGSDHHTGWANAAMLKRAGIDAARVRALPEEQRNTIGHDADATPNGFLADAGLDAVLAVLPAPSAEQMLEAGRSAVRYSNSLGLTAWMDPAANGSPGDALFSLRPDENTVGVLPVYQRLAKGGELSAHVAALLVANPRSRPADLEVLDKVRQRFLGSPNLTLPGIKVFADGVPEYPAQTAALLEPYRNSRKTGELLIDPAHFGELVSAADARGWLVHVHAIGDRAVREALNGMQQARRDRDSGIAHSITHLQLVNPKEFRALQAAWRDRLDAAVLGRRRRNHGGPDEALYQCLRLPLPVPGALPAEQGRDHRRGQRLAGVQPVAVEGHPAGGDPQGPAGRAQRRRTPGPPDHVLRLHPQRCADHRPGTPDRQPGAGQAGGLHRPRPRRVRGAGDATGRNQGAEDLVRRQAGVFQRGLSPLQARGPMPYLRRRWAMAVCEVCRRAANWRVDG